MKNLHQKTEFYLKNRIKSINPSRVQFSQIMESVTKDEFIRLDFGKILISSPYQSFIYLIKKKVVIITVPLFITTLIVASVLSSKFIFSDSAVIDNTVADIVDNEVLASESAATDDTDISAIDDQLQDYDNIN